MILVLSMIDLLQEILCGPPHVDTLRRTTHDPARRQKPGIAAIHDNIQKQCSFGEK